MPDGGSSWSRTGTVPPPPSYSYPGPTGPPPKVRAGRRRRLGVVAFVLLAVAAVLHVVALFPSQGAGFGAQSAQTSLVVMDVIVAVGWLGTAGLVGVGLIGVGLAGERFLRLGVAGAAVAVGLALAEVGFVIATFGQIAASVAPGAGLWLLAAAWVVGAAGAVAAVIAQPLDSLGRPGGPRASRSLTVLTALSALLLGGAVLPAWDRYVIHIGLTGASHTIHAGSAFAHGNPLGLVVGDVVAAVALGAVPILAALWRPARIGLLAIAGVLVVVAGQLASAVTGLAGTTAAQFATPAQVRQLGITVAGSSLTFWFDLETMAAVALLLLATTRWWTPEQVSFPPGGVGWPEGARARPPWAIPTPPNGPRPPNEVSGPWAPPPPWVGSGGERPPSGGAGGAWPPPGSGGWESPPTQVGSPSAEEDQWGQGVGRGEPPAPTPWR